MNYGGYKTTGTDSTKELIRQIQIVRNQTEMIFDEIQKSTNQTTELIEKMMIEQKKDS